MNTLDHANRGIENSETHARDHHSAGPIVNMANQNEVRGTFRPGEDHGQSVFSKDGHMIFDNPYGDFEHVDWHNDNAVGRSKGDNGNPSSSNTSDNPANLERQLLRDLHQEEKQIEQVMTELTNLLQHNGVSSGSSDSAGGPCCPEGKTHTPPSDSTGSTPHTPPSDSTGSTPNTPPSDSNGSTPNTPPSDSNGSSPNTPPSDANGSTPRNPATSGSTLDAGSLQGVNVSGPEWGTNGDYAKWPTASELQQYHAKGLNTIRLPISWENFQSSAGAPLNQNALNNLSTVMKEAQSMGMSIILDNHNYDKYFGKTANSAELGNFWGQMANFVNKSAYGSSVIGYDLMNEPHAESSNAATSMQDWQNNAQASINAIRATGDYSRSLFIEADASWTGAFNSADDAQARHNLLQLNDPAGKNKDIYEVHTYWDSNHSGSYAGGQDSRAQANPEIGVQAITSFVQWLKANHVQGYVGEFSVPKNSPAWIKAENNFLQYLNQNNVGWTSWGGGQYWGQDRQAIDGTAAENMLSNDVTSSSAKNLPA